VVLNDGDEVLIGDSVLIAKDTPGHARHHHVYICNDVVFAGDVAGVRLAGQNYISVTSAPPQFDEKAYEQSIRKLLEGNYSKLYLTHFGEVTEVEDHLKNYLIAVKSARAFIEERIAEGAEKEGLQIVYEAFQMERAFQAGVPPELWSRYQVANPTAMCADGLRLYQEKKSSS
jgi:glyoxylase-like metal-dependent hydrolase (beta-lactamase superfamily II)